MTLTSFELAFSGRSERTLPITAPFAEMSKRRCVASVVATSAGTVGVCHAVH